MMKENMKPSGIEWIGEIPEHWEVGRIQYNYEVILGKMVTPEQETIDQTLENYLCAANISWNGVDVGINKQMWYSLKEKSQYLLKINDVLIMEGGSIGTTCVYNGEFAPCYIQNSVHCCRGKESNNTKLLYYWMSLIFNSGFLDVVCNKATIAHYTKEKVCKTPLLLIPPIEQTRIANYLDKQCGKIDSIIADLEKQIDILGQYKKSLITETVTRGLDKTVPLKDSGIEWIGKIPEHWEVSKLKYLLKTPLLYGANEAGEDFDPNYPRYIRITDIDENNKLKNEGELSLLPNIAKPYLLCDGDILFARSGATVGKTFLYLADYGVAAFAGYLIKANLDLNESVPKYVYYTTLGTGYENWKNTMFTQATIQNIGADKYSLYQVPVPTIQEQQNIVRYLDAQCSKIDSIIESKKEQLTKITEHKKSLIYEYVTGKKRVKGELNHGN